MNRAFFIDYMLDNGIVNSVSANDNNRGEDGQPSYGERKRRVDGIVLRDEMRDKLRNHGM